MIARRRERDGIVVLEATGEYWGGPETRELERAIGDEIAAGNVSLILDLSSCRAINSTAFGVLIEAHRACDRVGGVLKLCGARPRVRRLFDVLHAESLLEHHASLSEALASFAARATA